MSMLQAVGVKMYFLGLHEMLFPGLLLTAIGGGFYTSVLVKV